MPMASVSEENGSFCLDAVSFLLYTPPAHCPVLYTPPAHCPVFRPLTRCVGNSLSVCPCAERCPSHAAWHRRHLSLCPDHGQWQQPAGSLTAGRGHIPRWGRPSWAACSSSWVTLLVGTGKFGCQPGPGERCHWSGGDCSCPCQAAGTETWSGSWVFRLPVLHCTPVFSADVLYCPSSAICTPVSYVYVFNCALFVYLSGICTSVQSSCCCHDSATTSWLSDVSYLVWTEASCDWPFVVELLSTGVLCIRPCNDVVCRVGGCVVCVSLMCMVLFDEMVICFVGRLIHGKITPLF